MKESIKDMDIGALLGALETIRECLNDAGFPEVSMDLWLKNASNEEMTDLGAKFKSGDSYTDILMGSDSNVYLKHRLDGYAIHSLKMKESKE